MKKIILLLLIFFSVTSLFAQTDTIKKNTLRTSFAVNWIESCYFSDGLMYMRRESEKRSWGVGIEHSYWEQDFRRSVILPLRIIRHYRRPIFLSYGLLLIMDSYDYYGFRKERDFYCGFEFGMGYEHIFPSGIALSVFPNLRLIGLSFHAGLSFGVGYKF